MNADFEITYSAAMEREVIRAAQRPPDPVPVHVKIPRIVRPPQPIKPSIIGRVRELLQQGGWYTAREVSEAVGVHLSSTYDALMQLRKQGRIESEQPVDGRRRNPQRYGWVKA